MKAIQIVMGTSVFMSCSVGPSLKVNGLHQQNEGNSCLSHQEVNQIFDEVGNWNIKQRTIALKKSQLQDIEPTEKMSINDCPEFSLTSCKTSDCEPLFKPGEIFTCHHAGDKNLPVKVLYAGLIEYGLYRDNQKNVVQVKLVPKTVETKEVRACSPGWYRCTLPVPPYHALIKVGENAQTKILSKEIDYDVTEFKLALDGK